jgi:RNA polymerase sigma factor (sigma-70 family)
MNNLTDLAKHHKEYIKIVKTFGGNINPEDVVQEMYIRLHNHLERNPECEMNLFYCWSTLRNIFFDMYREDTRYCDKDINDFHFLEEQEPNHEEQEAYSQIQQNINKVVNKQHHFDARLFEIYTNRKTSIRKLSKETCISSRTIFWSLQQTKKLIRKELKEDYEDYKNEDYELIKEYKETKQQLTLF